MTGTDLHAWALSLPVTAAASLLVFTAAFAIGAKHARYRVADVAWGLAFTAIAAVGFGLSSGHGDVARRILVLVLTAVWGLRLAWHIGRRSRGKPEDPRYEQLLGKARGSQRRYAFTHIFLLQAFLAWFISLPIQAAAFGTASPGPQTAAAVALWALGFAFEAVADRAQLRRAWRDCCRWGHVGACRDHEELSPGDSRQGGCGCAVPC